jgi:hypothetical protein
VIPRHEKIRFERRQIKKLHEFPSACGQARGPVRTPRRVRRLKLLVLMSFAVGCLVLLLGGAGFALLKQGIGGKMITEQARAALASVSGPQSKSSLGAARISIDERYHIALEANDVSVSDPWAGVGITGMRSLKLGLSPFALVMGRIEVARIEIDGADIDFAGGRQDTAFLTNALPFDDRGLVDLGDVSTLVLERLANLAGVLDRHHTSAVVLKNVSLSFTREGVPHQMRINSFELEKSLTGRIELNGSIQWNGKPVTLAADMTRDRASGAVKDFDLDVQGIRLSQGAADTMAHLGKPGGDIWDDMRISGKAEIALRGSAGRNGSPTTVSARLDLDDGVFKYLGYPQSAVKATLNLEQTVGSHKIELKPSKLSVGGLDMSFNGAFGPAPGGSADAGGKPAYRFEIVTSSAASAPHDSPEQAVPFGARVAGLLIPSDHNLAIQEIALRTFDGELYGQGSMIFGQGSPGMIFALRIPHLPVTQFKQLWPLPIADGARRWVLPNVFGGMVTNGSIDVAFAPGRFSGPGIPPPLTADEIKVDADIENTRFNVLGDLPAVRDASGHVSVRGAHTVVDLSKGTAYLPDNRTADISNGHFDIPWGPQRPVLAALSIDVDGEAGAIARIVGYKPLDALHYVDFGADDITGKVASHIAVSFPITENAPPGSLTWSAAMDFSNLSIAKPLDGQMVSDAKGTLKVTQDSAAIDAKAKLNGIPAKVTLFEPFTNEGAKRQRTVSLELDDKARDKLVPELGGLVSGPVFVNLATQSPKDEVAAADLSRAELTVPWVGWSKGAGVNATATFSLVQDGKRTQITGLELSGDTFRVRGHLTLGPDGLDSADLSQVRLNKGDDAAVQVDRTKGGYRINVVGKAFDARALVKQLKSNFGGSGGGAANDPHLTIHAAIDRVTGFNGETLHDVRVDYDGAVGSGNEQMTFNAVTASGAPLNLSMTTRGGAKAVRVDCVDAGSVLRFFDLYSRMQGGKLVVSLSAPSSRDPLDGAVDIRNFTIVQDPSLARLVTSRPTDGGRSLNEAVQKRIDVSSVEFRQGFSKISVNNGYVKLDRGILRGPAIGTTFQGTLLDPQGNMSITGTFMPAYGLNSIFGALPLVGQILGNGRERGLIGITYKLQGPAKNPDVLVNPISAIAPGLFRSIFEFR